MNRKQLTLAREYRGFSQTELANAIEGLSQSNLSKFEKGIDVLSDKIQKEIIKCLNFPEEFFNRRVGNVIENSNYRKKGSIRKSEAVKFENTCRILGYMVDEMSESIEWPVFSLTPLNVEDGYSPEYIANYTRKLLKLNNDEPLRDIYTLLEESGIIIYEMDATDKFDGISFFTHKGYPMMVVNKNFSNDRKRFTIAHELGHILMHIETHYPISSYRDKEAEANEFAGEFLMPQSEIKNSLRGLKLSHLGVLKSYWLTSMASIIRRARDLNCICNDRYKYFMIEMSRRGYGKTEPQDVFIDGPYCFENGYLLFKNDLNYSDGDFTAYLALPKDILDNIFRFDRVNHLKIVFSQSSS